MLASRGLSAGVDEAYEGRSQCLRRPPLHLKALENFPVFQVRISTIVACYFRVKPLEEDGYTAYNRGCLSGGFIARTLVLTNNHGVRLKGSGLVKQKRKGGDRVGVEFIQIAASVQAH